MSEIKTIKEREYRVTTLDCGCEIRECLCGCDNGPELHDCPLHAAAPELLEALKVAEHMLRILLGRKSVKTHFHEINALENCVRPAIAKAGGG